MGTYKVLQLPLALSSSCTHPKSTFTLQLSYNYPAYESTAVFSHIIKTIQSTCETEIANKIVKALLMEINTCRSAFGVIPALGCRHLEPVRRS